MYEPVVVDYLSVVIALAIGAFIAVCVLWGAINPDSVKPLKIPDKFEIGYIEDNNPLAETSQLVQEYDELKDLERQVKIKKLKKQLKEMDEPKTKTRPKKVETKQQVNPLITECVQALVGMGEKQSVARSTVNKYFVNNPNTKSVEDFISGVFKK